MEWRVGIVLKNYVPAKCKVALLDKEHGAVVYVTRGQMLCPGALIRYTVHQSGTMTILDTPENLYIPLGLAQHDILFLHHILELCYYFVPIGGTASEVLGIIEFLYMHTMSLRLSVLHKKFFVLKVFSALGIYPENRATHTPRMYQLAATSIDRLLQVDLDLTDEKSLDAWLYNCLLTHPHNDKFKTTHFLEESKVL